MIRKKIEKSRRCKNVIYPGEEVCIGEYYIWGKGALYSQIYYGGKQRNRTKKILISELNHIKNSVSISTIRKNVSSIKIHKNKSVCHLSKETKQKCRERYIKTNKKSKKMRIVKKTQLRTCRTMARQMVVTIITYILVLFGWNIIQAFFYASSLWCRGPMTCQTRGHSSFPLLFLFPGMISVITWAIMIRHNDRGIMM